MNILKARAGFGLMTYRFLVKALTNCTTLLGSISGKEFIKLLLDFIVYFDRKYFQYESAPTTILPVGEKPIPLQKIVM